METKICKSCGRELPISEMYSNALGVTNVCRDCRKKKYNETIAKRKKNKSLEEELANAKILRLQDFTPRELLQELKRRGYEWTSMRYVEIKNIDFDSI